MLMLYGQMIAISRLFLPIAVGYLIAPEFTLSRAGALVLSTIFALGMFYQLYQSSMKEANTVVYVPTGDVLTSLQSEIKRCGMEPEAIKIGYTYLFDQVAQSLFSTIKIDPLVWKNCDNDPVKQQIITVLDTHVMPAAPADRTAFIQAINSHLTPEAQRFIFRHELGHIASSDSLKRISSFSGIVFATIASGITIVGVLAPVITIIPAAIAGLVVACLVDILLSAINNHFTKAAQEKNADIFATQMSSFEETVAAAEFFKAYDEAMHTHLSMSPTIFTLLGLPSSYARGYYSGAQRSEYLTELAHRLKEQN